MRKPGIIHIGPVKFRIFLMMTPILLSCCSHFGDGRRAKTTFAEANDLFHHGSYTASLEKYSEIAEKYPAKADRALFEMGIVYAHPKNERKDYQKSLDCFQRIIKEYPGSEYRQNSEMMMFNIRNVVHKDQAIAAQRMQIEALRHEVQGKENEIVALQKKIEALDQRFLDDATQKRSVDRILIEKSARRLTVISRGDVLKTYKIALGGNPIGPKERQGDNKTPEGTYVIDARNRDSRYHLSLHISYPNEEDKNRARELGVSPGGDIMIHGIKNGSSWVGNAHAQVDWTNGCIAVTNEEIEEIARLAPNGTIVQIRP
ncbi:MAG TPA: L,D-transpeptidase family protein [Terriglobales bacterium]|jgi:outer membrane protein assembly factor BamD (BamD/ComL family)|nr:L,D-transpeptidase family protein [Terriglobales bacterium]